MAMSYKTSEAVKYRTEFADYVRQECEKQNWNFIPNKWQHFYVDAVFYFNRFDMDCNNYFKVMLDAITDTQLIWLDDNVVCERVQRIYYDAVNPHIELTIRPVDYIGIFDDASHLDDFTTKCIECTRYKRNCSILKNAKLGKIQKEIIDGVCSARKQAKTPNIKAETKEN